MGKKEREKISEKKETYRELLIQYLSNNENQWPRARGAYGAAIGIHEKTFRNHFSPEEINEMEAEALKLRRAAFASQSAQVDNAVVRQALSGDVTAAKLFYQHREGWNPKQEVSLLVSEIPLEDFE